MEILARAVGRRKEAVAQVQLVRGNGQFLINDKPAQAYLQNNSCSLICIKSPLQAALSLFPNNPIETASYDGLTPRGLGILSGAGTSTQSGEEKVTLLKKGDPGETQEKSDPLVNQEEQISGDSCCPLAKQGEATASGVFNWGEKEGEIDIIVKVKGGGLIGQAEAIKLGVARAFCIMENVYGGALLRKILKTKGYLTQDSRVKERRKYGLKKARKASQYHKR